MVSTSFAASVNHKDEPVCVPCRAYSPCWPHVPEKQSLPCGFSRGGRGRFLLDNSLSWDPLSWRCPIELWWPVQGPLCLSDSTTPDLLRWNIQYALKGGPAIEGSEGEVAGGRIKVDDRNNAQGDRKTGGQRVSLRHCLFFCWVLLAQGTFRIKGLNSRTIEVWINHWRCIPARTYSSWARLRYNLFQLCLDLFFFFKVLFNFIKV